MTGLRDLAGQRFGRLLVIERAENAVDGRVQWRCVCDCGASVVKKSILMTRTKGPIQSCNCYRDEASAERAKAANYAAAYYAAHPEVKKSPEALQARAKEYRQRYYREHAQEMKARAKAWDKSTNYVKKSVDALADTYVRGALKCHLGIRGEVSALITPAMIALKREQMLAARLSLEIKRAIEKECPQCGESFACRHDEPPNNFVKRRYCSQKCYDLFRATQAKERNPL